MKIVIGKEITTAESKLANDYPDNSGIGVHYVDEYIKQLNLKNDDFEVKAKRKGLKVMLKINGELGIGLMRRLDVSSDPKVMLQSALKEAAKEAGFEYTKIDGDLVFEK
jgi:hypothetical protein